VAKRRKKRRLKASLRRRYEAELIRLLGELSLPLLLLHAAITVGTLGYMALGGDFLNSFYMTIITIGTIGFGEVLPQFSTPKARIFTSFLALAGIGIFTSSVTMIVRVFLKEDLIAVWRQIRMFDAIAELKGHYIVAGYNRTALELFRLLKRRGIPVVIVDGRRELDRELRAQGIPYYVLEDPIQRTALEAAGIRRARGLIANLKDDAKNISQVAVTRLLRPEEEFEVYAFASTPDAAERMEALGATRAFLPNRMLAGRLAAYILHPESAYVGQLLDRIAFGEETEVDILEIVIDERHPWAGKTIEEINRSFLGSVIAIRTADGRLVTELRFDRRVEPGEALILFGPVRSLRKLKEEYGVGQS